MGFVGNVQLVRGNSKTTEAILALLKKEGIQTQGNPDIYLREYSSFGVDEARELSQRASTKAVSSDRRIFIIVTPSMTSESQNALLKTLEEPAGNSLFFIVVPSPQMLLPTLRSRSQVLHLGTIDADSLVDPKQFLDANPQKRLDMLKPLLEKDDDDKRDISASVEFLSAVEKELSKNVKQHEAGLEAVYRARKYIGDKGSLSKALLEQVALLI